MTSLEDKMKIASYIREEIDKEFSEYFVSRNLVDTIEIYDELSWDGSKCAIVSIPAEIYDYHIWKNHRAIIYTNEGSYASEVNERGGYSKRHVDYIDKAIERAIERWSQESDFAGVIIK